MASRAKNLARRLRDLKDEHTEVLDRRAVYAHDINRAVNALRSWGKEKERTEAQRPSNLPQQAQEQAPPSNQDSQSQDVDKIVEEAAAEAEASRPEAPPWAKKAYRKVVQITHPDKVNIDPDTTDAQKERLCALYIEASEAFREGKWSELLEVAAELEVEVDADPKMMEEALESKIKELSETISKIQGTIAWAWGNSFGDMNKRVNVLNRCCEVMQIIPPPRPALEEIVRELEGNLEFDIVDRLGHVKRLKVESTKRKIGSRPQKRLR
jgi:hypothetical protein